jgi:hypothetical protein
VSGSENEKHWNWWRSLPPLEVTMSTALKLPEYSASNPTGAWPGKMWRRDDGAYDHEAKARGVQPLWVIRTYEKIPGDDKNVLIGTYRAVIRVPMGRRVVLHSSELSASTPGDVAWSDAPLGRRIHALVGGKFLTWDAEAGRLRDEDGNAYTLVMT